MLEVLSLLRQILMGEADNNKYDSDSTDYEDLLPFSQKLIESHPPELPPRRQASKKNHLKKFKSFSETLSFNQSKEEYDSNFKEILLKLKEILDQLEKELHLLHVLSLTGPLVTRNADFVWQVAVTNDYLPKVSEFLKFEVQDGSNASKKTYQKTIKSVCKSSENNFSEDLSLNQDEKAYREQEENFDKIVSELKIVRDSLQNQFDLLLEIDMTHREDVIDITLQMATIKLLLSITDNYFETLALRQESTKESVRSSRVIKQKDHLPSLLSEDKASEERAESSSILLLNNLFTESTAIDDSPTLLSASKSR